MQKMIKGLAIIMLVSFITLPVNLYAQEEKEQNKITWSAWGRVIIAPMVSNDKGDTVPRDLASWGGDSRIGFTIEGKSENVGFHVDMKADGGRLEGMQDQQKVWVKPFNTLTIEGGVNVFYDELRGNSAFGSWNWLRFNGIEGEDNIFARGQAGGGDGTRTPNASGGCIIHLDTDGYHIFGAWNIIEEGEEIQIGDDFRDADGDGQADREQYSSALMFQRGQYGIGYEIEDFGMIRAQYIGKAYVKDITKDELQSYGIVNAALKIDQLIENLYFDVGVFVPTDEDNTKGDNTTVAAYSNMKFGNFTPHFLVEAEFDKEDAAGKKDTGIKAGVGLDIGIGNGYVINTDFRYHNETAVAVEGVDNQLAFLAGIEKEFDNGVCGIGFEGTTHTFGDVEKENVDDFAWAIAVKLEYSF